MVDSEKRDPIVDSWTYISLSKLCSPTETSRNKRTYLGLSFLAGLLGSIGSIIICGIFLWIFVEVSELFSFPDIILRVVSIAILFGVIQIAIIGHSMIMAPFIRSFFRNGLRPFFLIKEIPSDPYIGRIFIDEKQRVATVYSIGGFINEDGQWNYNTYYVEDGVQHDGEAYTKSELGKYTLLATPPSSPITLPESMIIKQKKPKVATNSANGQLDSMDVEMMYQYLIQNVESEDAVLIIQNQIVSKEEQEKQLSNEFQERGISLQRSIEIAQERKNVLNYIERLKLVSDMLMEDNRQKVSSKDTPNALGGVSQASLISVKTSNTEIQNPSIEESHIFVPVESYAVSSTPEVQDESQRKLSGWESFFQVVVSVGIFGTVVNLFFGVLPSLGLFPGWMLCLETVALLSFATLGFMVLVTFQNRSSNAIFLAKSYIVLFAFNYIVGALSGTIDPSKAIGASIVGGAWFAYFTFSKNIAEVFPTDQRLISLTTKLIVIVIGVLILADHVAIGWFIKSSLQ